MTVPHVADTARRVEKSTAEKVNQQIQFATEGAVLHYAHKLDQVHIRLRNLRAEWDIERSLQTNAGIVMSAGVMLGIIKKPLTIMSAAVAAFMFVHAINGWCPPLPLMRRAGIRTAREINREKYALKALRGDFDGLGPAQPGTPAEKAKKALQAVSSETQSPASRQVPLYDETVSSL